MDVWKYPFLMIAIVMGMSMGAAPTWAEDTGFAQQPLANPASPSPAQGAMAAAPVKQAPGGAVASESPVVVPAELPAVERRNGPKTATDKIVEKFMALDVDASAGVSMDEYITLVQQRVMARFAAMDGDGDGEVSEDEYRAFWKSRMAKWYRLKR